MLINDAMTLWSRHSRLLILSAIIFCSLLSLYYSRNHAHAVFVSLRTDLHKSTEPSTVLGRDFPNVRNSTLGFEQVYILNLPERSDKLDTFLLTSSATNFSFTVIPGVDGSTVPDKALPSVEGLPEKEGSRNRSVGSWRAHLNFAKAIVENRLSTAMLFEDDADWDISFKTQLEHFAAGSRALSNHTSTDKPHSPYGDGWDLLWLGHCGIVRHDKDSRTFIVDNDPSTPPPNHRVTFGSDGVDMTSYSNSSRVVFQSGGGLCVYAYALSFRGAQKMLLTHHTKNKYKPFDLALHFMCKDDPDFKCLAVFPQIVDSHKAAGAVDRDSDIADLSENKEIRKKGYTFNIVRSVRINLKKLVLGKGGEDMDLQWDDQPPVDGPITTRWEE